MSSRNLSYILLSSMLMLLSIDRICGRDQDTRLRPALSPGLGTSGGTLERLRRWRTGTSWTGTGPPARARDGGTTTPAEDSDRDSDREVVPVREVEDSDREVVRRSRQRDRSAAGRATGHTRWRNRRRAGDDDAAAATVEDRDVARSRRWLGRDHGPIKGVRSLTPGPIKGVALI
jgi:hypothetical protein